MLSFNSFLTHPNPHWGGLSSPLQMCLHLYSSWGPSPQPGAAFPPPNQEVKAAGKDRAGRPESSEAAGRKYFCTAVLSSIKTTTISICLWKWCFSFAISVCDKTSLSLSWKHSAPLKWLWSVGICSRRGYCCLSLFPSSWVICKDWGFAARSHIRNAVSLSLHRSHTELGNAAVQALEETVITNKPYRK